MQRPQGVHVADYVKHAEDDMEPVEVLFALAMINEEEDGDETNADAFNDDRAIETFHNRYVHWEEGNNVLFKDAKTTKVSEREHANAKLSKR